MKRKVLSLLLVLFLIPGALVLSACKKDKGYNLGNLSSDFYSIADSATDSIVKQGNELVFNYDGYMHNSSAFLNDAIEDIEVYSNLEKYNYVFENIMAFTYNYIDVCSNKDADISEEVRSDVQNSLSEFHTAMRDVSSCTDMFAELLKITPDSEKATNVVCLQRFEYLLNSYETLYKKAANFSSKVENIYFNLLISNSNPNIAAVSLADFDANVVVNNLNARIKWQISNLSRAFVEMYICDGEISENVKNGTNLNLDTNSYRSKINAINIDVDAENAAEIANNATNKETFYNLSTQAYSAQVIVNNDSAKFITACNNIDYTDVVANLAEATSSDLVNKKIIEDYQVLLADYNDILEDMVDIIDI